jgi:hypothetical protein
VNPSVLPKALERPFASALRSAAFRGALFAVLVFAALLLLIGGIVLFVESGPPGGLVDMLVPLAITSVLLGITAAPLTFLETFLARRDREPARDRLAALGIAAVAFALMIVASLQIAYTEAIVRTGSVERAARAVRDWVETGLLEDPSLFTLFAVLAVPFAPATLGRVRDLPQAAVLRMTLAWGSLLAAPFFLVILVKVQKAEVGLVFGVGLVVVYGLLPLVLELADKIESRVSARLERAEP